MRLVVSGYYGYGNAGDEAMLAGMLKLAGEAGTDRRQVTVLSGHPGLTSRLHDVHAVSRWDLRRIATVIRKSDGLISGGGGLLQDATSARTVAYYAGVMQLTSALGRPYVVLAQGLGPLRRRVNRRIAAHVLRRAERVSFRDDASIALARRIGVRRPIERAADPALALDPAAERRSSHVLVAVRGGSHAETVIPAMRDVVTELAHEHRVLVLPMHDAVDRDASEAVAAGVRGASVADVHGSLDETLRAIAGASIVIGVRLHALILAAAAGVPAVAIPYDAKVGAFAVRAGIPIAGSSGSPLDGEQVLDAVHRSLARDPEAYADRVREMRAEARSAVVGALDAIEAARRPTRHR